MYLIVKHWFDTMENHNPHMSTIVGYVENEAQADSYIECHKNEKQYKGWDGVMYPYYTKEIVNNLYTTPKEDGIYAEFFAVKNGNRYSANTINIRDMTKILTNTMLDGINKIIGV